MIKLDIYTLTSLKLPHICLWIILLFINLSCTYHPPSSANIHSFQKLKILSLATDLNSAEPYLFSSAEGEVYCSWIEEKDLGIHELRFAHLINGSWGESHLISKGKDWFVNWADFPAIAVTESGHMVSHFLEKSAESTYAYNIQLVQSFDAGQTWNETRVLHDDGTKSEHGFVSILETEKEDFLLTWLDGRNTSNNEKDTDGDHAHAKGAMTIRSTFLDSTGQNIEERELDSRVCDCCQTSSALTANGPIVVYRDRSNTEIRDISIVRYEDGRWTQPKTVYPDNWQISGCPVNGPKADAIGNHLAVAWFSAPDNIPQVKLIFSHDGGRSFGKEIRVDNGNPLGRVDIVLLDEKTALISWLESGSEEATILASIVSSDGNILESHLISKTKGSRASGFPQMAKGNEGIVFAWTGIDSLSRIETAILPYSK